MLTFLLDNIGTIVVLLIVVAVVAAIIISHFRAKKKGKSSCGSCAELQAKPHMKFSNRCAILSPNRHRRH